MNPHPGYKPVFTLTLNHRTLQLTREGGGFLVLVIGIGLAAINTGNNLLYLILAMCCSFIAVSGLLSEFALKRISAEAKLPKTTFAGETAPLTLTLRNGKKWAPSYAIHISLEADSLEQFRQESPAYVFHLPAGAAAHKTLRLTALRRGLLRLRSCRLSTSFPFGFFIKLKSIPIKAETVVYPAIHPVHRPDPHATSLRGEGVLQSHGDDLYALRDFKSGDPLSAIHWKSSAKTGLLRVKEFAGGGQQSFIIILNLTDPKTHRPVDEEVLEKRVSEAASLTYHLIRRGDEVGLKTHEADFPLGNSEQHLESLLRYMAFAGRETPR
ncbi:MAG: DUF58 domain-containing protein [Nitrospinaceae bacterium]